ncbi:MAG TPA: response regulator, partial [Cyclobacteriaceae bacterium]|nr:response regulator [Cyclobacteriaceae bacterium]
MKIRIAIADDSSVVRKSLLDKLSGHADIIVKHVAPNGRLLIEKLQQDANVDLILMDLKMPQFDGIETTREISR